jgi:hypothetical protein
MKSVIVSAWLCTATFAAMTVSPTFAAVNEIRWSGNDTFELTMTVAPCKSAEACGQIDPRFPVEWRYAASAPVDFNIHRHSREEIIYATKSVLSREDRGRHAPTFSFEWCWMWTNVSDVDVSIRVDLKR